MTRPNLRTDVHLGPSDLAHALRADARAGLTAAPKELPPKWFYDDRGSALFDEITRLEEYYPTRREREILVARAGEIAAASGADTLVELGSGTSEKTRMLLDAVRATGRLRRFIPFDISEATLLSTAGAILDEYPGIEVHAIVGDFEHHLGTIPPEGRQLVAFLGGTIGNLRPAERARFLATLVGRMSHGDALLLGTDLVKDRERLERAYDDDAGVTAEFNRNVLHVLNRELRATFEPDLFEHVALWDPRNEWIEMRLRAMKEHTVTLTALGMEVSFAEGEEMRTEISAKFTRQTVERELRAAGLRLARWWTDRAGDFALSLAVLD
ncbi:MAG TPA: L-histidine N(alpha)-methyltransferase [Actinomycetota bacterium]